MAIAFANLGVSASPDIFSTSNASSYANSSWTPPTTGMIGCWVANTHASATTIPTISGNGITWVQIATVSLLSGIDRRLTLFAANAAGASAGVTTIDYAGSNQTGTAASFFQITGADEANGVAQSFVQTLNNNGSAALSGSVTLAAAANSNNRPISAFIHNANEVVTPQTNWTELDDGSYINPSFALESQFRSDAFDTAAAASWATSSIWIGMAAEVKVLTAAANPPFIPSPRLRVPGFSRSGPPMRVVQTRPAVVATTTTTVDVTVAGSVTLTGQVLGLTTQITPTAGAETLTGQALGLSTSLGIVAGAVTLTGQTLGLSTQVAPIAGAITLTGQALGLSSQITPTAGSVTLTGQTLGLTTNVAPTAGAVTFTGQSVGLTTSIGLTAGAVTFTGQALGLSTSIALTEGAITLTGQALGLSTSIALTAGAITLTGQTVTLVNSTVVDVTVAGAVTLTGQALGLSTAVAITAGAVTLTGQSVGLSTAVALTAGSITLAGQSVGLSTTLALTAGAATFTGQVLGLTTSTALTAGAITFTGQTVTVGPAPSLFTVSVTVSGSVVFTGRDCVILVRGHDAMEQGRKARQRGRLRQGSQYSHR